MMIYDINLRSKCNDMKLNMNRYSQLQFKLTSIFYLTLECFKIVVKLKIVIK